ncbi:nicotinate-nucleotide diphosphorylase [Calderihabitans maritimus]|uniref:nicotinate-nucleotide diphosphorylase n=1 Tax=Calderihabitans maritimus TaxID=1246530 RepID=UPI000B51075B|nr:nicotinate-nucleotide pyrophosphorylase [Calderihabitans maritimus]
MDIREHLFAELHQKVFGFEIRVNQAGVLAGVRKAVEFATELGLKIEFFSQDGDRVEPGHCVFRGKGEAEKIVRAEEMMLGCLGKPSGVATAANRAVELAGERLKVVCGAWKKVAAEVRQELRQAIKLGGAGIRITEEPFVYLDKNYIRMLGGITPAVERAKMLPGRSVVVQLRGNGPAIEGEAKEAVEAGAGILMIDTGDEADLKRVIELAQRDGWRDRVKIAFAGGVTFDKIPRLANLGADIVDVGRAIIDAPLLDFRLDVTG